MVGKVGWWERVKRWVWCELRGGSGVQRLFRKSWRASGPRLKSRHNYSISMLSCASVFLYSSNLSQPTRHMRPSEKEPVRAPLCPQPSTSLPSPSHWLWAVDGSQGKTRGIMGAASALVALVVIDKTLAKGIYHHWKTTRLLKVSFSGRKKRIFCFENAKGWRPNLYLSQKIPWGSSMFSSVLAIYGHVREGWCLFE